MVNVGMIAGVNIGISHRQKFRCFQNDIGHIIDRILDVAGFAVIVGTPDGQGLVGAAPGKQGLGRLRRQGNIVGYLEKEVTHQLNGPRTIGIFFIL